MNLIRKVLPLAMTPMRPFGIRYFCASVKTKSFPSAWKWATFLGTIPLGYYFLRSNTNEKNEVGNKAQTKELLATRKANEAERQKILTQKRPQSFLNHTIFILGHITRFFHLLIIFTPLILLFPLTFFDKTNDYWMNLLVRSIERAGVVWIKAFQYMSHRRDIIGEVMAEKFVHLRENAPQHSYEETKKNFKLNYGQQIEQIFEEFDQEPIASGSVSQVYKAKYKGKKVAIKVRHPGVDKYIERDINLLFFFSRFLSIFSKTFSIPVTEVSMKKTMSDQINFINQKENMIIFQQFFKDRSDINFPTPIQSHSSDSVLVETFVNGVPITYYELNEHPLKPVIAQLGAQTFFDMLIKHNFIHADAHGGNIMVSMKQKSYTFFGEIWEWLKEHIICIEDRIVANTIQSDLLRKLYMQGREEAAHIRKLIRDASEKVVITVIDTGMVITLDEKDRKNFIGFIHNVLQGNGNQCAKQIYNLSSFGGNKIKDGQCPQYMNELKTLFKVIDDKDLQNLPGLELFTGMLTIIRKNQMKLEGQFATLLTNMLVLQGMAKDIYPQINILKVALPYFNKIQLSESHVETEFIPHD